MHNNQSPLRVHLSYEYTPDVIAYLRGRFAPGIGLTVGDDLAGLAECEFLVAGRPSREELLASDNLRGLIIPWAGLPPETRALLQEMPHIAAYNLHHNAGSVAEHTLALLLAAAKRIVPFDQALRKGDWSLRYAQPREVITLAGKTALILGYGAIGRRVAQLLQVMDITTLATRRHGPFKADGVVSELHPPDVLRELLPRADVLIIALPHTPETDNLLGELELALLPHGSILVNVGRGPIVNEQALYDALVNGPLGAAALDVWYNYPADETQRSGTPPTNLPLADLDNIVFSPHRAGLTAEIDYIRMDALADLLNAVAAGQDIPPPLDIHKGY